MTQSNVFRGTRNESWVIGDSEPEFLDEVEVVAGLGRFLVAGQGVREGTPLHEFEMALFLNTSLVVKNTFSPRPPTLEDSIIRHSNNTNDWLRAVKA